MTSSTNLIIEDMTCGGCVASISKVVKNLDASATVSADVTTKRVVITSHKDAQALIAVITSAGFHPALA